MLDVDGPGVRADFQGGPGGAGFRLVEVGGAVEALFAHVVAGLDADQADVEARVAVGGEREHAGDEQRAARGRRGSGRRTTTRGRAGSARGAPRPAEPCRPPRCRPPTTGRCGPNGSAAAGRRPSQPGKGGPPGRRVPGRRGRSEAGGRAWRGVPLVHAGAAGRRAGTRSVLRPRRRPPEKIWASLLDFAAGRPMAGVKPRRASGDSVESGGEVKLRRRAGVYLLHAADVHVPHGGPSVDECVRGGGVRQADDGKLRGRAGRIQGCAHPRSRRRS